VAAVRPGPALPAAFGGAVREPAPRFDAHDHVLLHAPTGDLHTIAGRLLERPMDRDRPPWAPHVLPGEDGLSVGALVTFHHALADGLRAPTLAAGLLDPVGPPAARTRSEKPRRAARHARAARPPHGRRLRRRAGPGHGPRPGPARSATDVRSPTARTAEPTGTRRTAGAVLDIDDVHRVRKTAGGTVNDVVLAIVADAPRRRPDERGDSSAGLAHGPWPPCPGAARAAPTRRATGCPAASSGSRVGEPDPLARLWFGILATSVPLPSRTVRLDGHP
jgi:hypothetical protein